MLKHLIRIGHRWVGLSAALMFVLLGLSGSVIAWLPEIDRALNRPLLQAGPPSDGHPLTPARLQSLLDRLDADPSYGSPAQLNLPRTAADVLIVSYRPVSAAAIRRQVMIDPYSLRIKGERDWGRVALSAPLLMPALLQLHRHLLVGETGKIITGIAALLLLLMAVSGVVLWWPGWRWRAMRHAFHVDYRGDWSRLATALHRIGGFFATPVLAILAFSGCYFNFPAWVVPLVNQVSAVAPSQLPPNLSPMSNRHISATAAMRVAQQRYPTAWLSRVNLPAQSMGPFDIRLRQLQEHQFGDGATHVVIDAFSGVILQVRDPLAATAGERFLSWQFPLHSGRAFGTGGRVFISVFGLVPLLLFSSGLLMWRRKRKRQSSPQ